MRIHLDTDLGSDPDDACALAMLLGWPGVELVGITTAIDPAGQRAGWVARCLALAGRDDIPVAAGAEVSLTTLELPGTLPDGERYWPSRVPPRPSPPGAALDLLHRDLAAGATVVAVGPYTNLALLEVARPGSLAQGPVVIMGGWLEPPPAGLPPWGPARDWNVQCDARAAELVIRAAAPTVVPLSVTLRCPLRSVDLPALREAGLLGRLLAGQAEAHRDDQGVAAMASRYPGLPDDLLNFHHDPLTAAVAAGWPGVTIEQRRVTPRSTDGHLWLAPDPDGPSLPVVVDVDGTAFGQVWLEAVRAAATG